MDRQLPGRQFGGSYKAEVGMLGGVYARKDLTGTSAQQFMTTVMIPEALSAAGGAAVATVAAFTADWYTVGKITPWVPTIMQAGADIGGFAADAVTDQYYDKHELGFSVAGWTDGLFRGTISDGYTIGAGARLQFTYGRDFPIVSTM